MAIGSAANAAYAQNWIKRQGLDTGPLPRLMMLLLAEECCAGAAKLDLEALGARCGVTLFEVCGAFDILCNSGALESVRRSENETFVWLPIATGEEVKDVVEHLSEVYS